MARRVSILIVLTLVAGVSAAAEPVATISDVHGDILLSRGAQWSPAQEGALLVAGDRLVALTDASALVAFADGCQQRLDADGAVTIAETNNCLAGPLAFRQAIGEPGGGSIDDDDDDDEAAAVPWGTREWTIAGAAILLPLLYNYHRIRQDDDDRDPVSR
jgi:hypothetical protein